MKNKRKRLSLVLSFCMAFAGLALQSCNEATPQMQKDKLNRGVVAVRESSEHVIISWRYLSSDPLNTSFNVYRDGEKIAADTLVTVDRVEGVKVFVTPVK